METLANYVKGYGRIPIVLVIGDKDYHIAKQDGYDSYYFMHGQEVLDRLYVKEDRTEALVLKKLNHKMNEEDLEELHKQEVYKKFIVWYKEQTGTDWSY